MRELTVKQKKFLVKWANENTDLMRKTADLVHEMRIDDWEKIVAMNDTEILYQNVNRFLNDLELKTHSISGSESYILSKD